jgi:hypothetical protein
MRERMVSLIYLVGWLLMLAGAIGLVFTGRWPVNNRRSMR